MKMAAILLTVMALQLSAGPATDYTFVRQFGQAGAESNRFWRMDGIAVDRFANVFVMDEYITYMTVGFTNTTPCVKRWATEGQYEHYWQSYEKYSMDAEGIDCSCDGEPYYVGPVYISPYYGSNIEHTNPDGLLYEKFPFMWGAAALIEYRFRDVAVSADGAVFGIMYLTTPAGSTNVTQALVMKFEWTGTQWTNVASVTVADTAELSGQLWAIDADAWRGRVYVTSLSKPGLAGAIRVYDLDLNSIQAYVPWGYPAMPTGVAVDNRDGTYLVTESVSNRIYKYALNGTEILQFGVQGTQPYEFNNPTDLDVDMNGWLYIADAGNNKVQVYAPPRKGNLNFIVYKSKIKVGWKQKLKGKDRDLILCKALAAIDVYTNITGMVGMPFSFWLNDLAVIPEMVPTKTNKKGTKALYAWDTDHKAKVQYRPDGALLRITVKLKRGNVNGPLNIMDTTPLPPWLWTTAQMTLSNEYLGVHYMRLKHLNKVGKVYKAWKK